MAGSRNRRMTPTRKNFGTTPPMSVPRSRFNLGKRWKGTFDFGWLQPFFCSEVIPGDVRRIRLSAIARLATPLKPLMSNLYLDFHFWWCPMRQLWSNTEKFFGEQENPGDSTDFLVPQTSVDGTADAELVKAFGLVSFDAAQVTAPYTVNALPFRMYNRVFNFHYRDQNLQGARPQERGDGPDNSADYVRQRRGKRHDYFTASLPFQQKGDPVQIPLGDTAPVVAFGDQEPTFNAGADQGPLQKEQTNHPNSIIQAGSEVGNLSWANPKLEVDLSSALSATISDMRQAIAVQHVLERDARSGSRYPEILLSRYRVFDPQMAVLQRPEYLGGGRQAISIAPIPQTAATSSDVQEFSTPQGNLAAVGTAMVNNIGFTRSFTEHGYIMGICSARADLEYQQGVERMWNKRERFDFFHPELAHLSEQAVSQKEIYVTGDPANDDLVWGYIGAYDEYRYGISLVTGDFRSDAATPLDIWHTAQYFASPPALNGTFIQENPPVDRVIAVPGEKQIIMDAFIEDVAARVMPVHGIPGLARI